MATKQKKHHQECPNCLVRTTFHRTHVHTLGKKNWEEDEDLDTPHIPAWECGNCSYSVARRARRTKGQMALDILRAQRGTR